MLRMLTPADTWGAVYRGRLPERFELSLEVKSDPNAVTDIHLADAGRSAFVRVSKVAADKAGKWVNVRFVKDRAVKVFVDGKEVPPQFWKVEEDVRIGLSSDNAESAFRNILLRALN